MKADQIASQLVDFIRERAGDFGSKELVVSLSGGIDSATLAYLCKEAYGFNHTWALLLPWGSRTLKSETDDGLFVAKTAGIRYRVTDISELVRSFYSFETRRKSDNGHSRALLAQRTRAVISHYFAEQMGGVYVNSGNYSEWVFGFRPLLGEAYLSPLAGLFKHSVFDIAKHLGVPNKILQKAPHSGMVGDGSDEEIYGLSYRTLDSIYYLWHFKKKESNFIAKTLNVQLEKVDELIKEAELCQKMAGHEIPSWLDVDVDSQFKGLEF